ncbi:MAG TPA: type VI secretion system baseplate subunit TssG [Phycisphaerae bacterium]|nr:type VI secretion system baseplate subunit TssG [Phycisphaerae bacterium]
MTDAGQTTRSPGGGVLMERLLSAGWQFDFFSAVWLLERYLVADDRVPVGERGPVAGEALCFRPHVSVGFPPTDVRRIIEAPSGPGESLQYVIDSTFMGLYGVSTPLPLHYAIGILRSVEPYSATEAEQTEAAPTDRPPAGGRATDSTPVRDFLDIFHHRLLSLFYRAWTKYRYDVVFGMSGRDRITDYLLRLIGCPPEYDEAVLGLSPIRLIRYAGVWTQHPRSAVTLEGLLRDYWKEIDVEVQQFVGRWVPLSPGDMNSIGTSNSCLGVDLTVGEQVYDLSGAFRIVLGPVHWDTYVSFLPDASRWAQTRSLVKLFGPDPLAFTIEIKVYGQEVPETRLSSDGEPGRLGFTSWVRTEELTDTSVLFDMSAAALLESGAQTQGPAAETELQEQVAAV